MLVVLALALLAQSPCGPKGPIFCGGESFAFFEFAPRSGRGMTAPCACTNPTGAKGEAMTFTRSSSATCLKCTTVTGIEDGDMVTCLTDQPRVMPGGDGGGGLGLLMENQQTNDCLRSAELCNAAWSDVGTPACAADQAVGPLGTATMDRLTDNDGAAFEGRSQAITTTSATQHSVSCFVKAGTATSASIALVGAGSSTGDCTGTATGLSTTTSTRVSCSSPAAYAGTLTSVTVTIRVGTLVADQGTLFVEGCQHEVSAAYPSSYIATAGVSATRAAERAIFPNPGAAVLTSGSAAATVATDSTLFGMVCLDNAGRLLYRNTTARIYDGTTEVAVAAGTLSASVPKRFASDWGGSTENVRNITDGTSASGSFDGTMAFSNFDVGFNCTTGAAVDGVIKQVCLDPSRVRCLQ